MGIGVCVWFVYGKKRKKETLFDRKASAKSKEKTNVRQRRRHANRRRPTVTVPAHRTPYDVARHVFVSTGERARTSVEAGASGSHTIVCRRNCRSCCNGASGAAKEALPRIPAGLQSVKSISQNTFTTSLRETVKNSLDLPRAWKPAKRCNTFNFVGSGSLSVRMLSTMT